MDLMPVSGFTEIMYALVMANSMHWYGDLLRREDGHVTRRALEFEVDGQKKKGRLKRTLK